MTITEAIKEAIWSRSLYDELRLASEATVVFCVNQRATHLIKDEIFHGRLRSSDIR